MTKHEEGKAGLTVYLRKIVCWDKFIDMPIQKKCTFANKKLMYI